MIRNYQEADAAIQRLSEDIRRLTNRVAALERPDTVDIVNLEKGRETLVGQYRGTVRNILVKCNATLGALAVALPDARGSLNQFFHIKKTDAGSNAVVVSGVQGQAINTQTSQTLAGEGDAMALISDGSNWHIV